ncbi:hypothetical protein GQ600_16107 [Phytophthora cactorum]|nr:hypothetical protein GQ600_16107 [Phytophthora cactorum]
MEVNNTRAQLDAMQLQHQQFTQRLQQVDTTCRDSEQREMALQTDITGCRSQRQELAAVGADTPARERPERRDRQPPERPAVRRKQAGHCEERAAKDSRAFPAEVTARRTGDRRLAAETAEYPARDRGSPAEGAAGPGHDPISGRGEAEGLCPHRLLGEPAESRGEEVDYMNCCINDAASDEA